VAKGRAIAAGWRVFRRVIIGYIGPDHADPVVDGTHRAS
jgi:hypothetical protein